MEKDGPFNAFAAQRQTIRENVKFWTYPLIQKMGLNINLHYINDPDDIRTIMQSEKLHGHKEMFGWWDLVLQYRKLVKGRKADVLSPTENGLMRDIDPINDPEGTKIAQLSRKRLMEFLSRKSMQTRLVATIDNETALLESAINKEGEDGAVAFDSIDVFVRSALNVVLRFALGIDLESNPERLQALAQVCYCSVFKSTKRDQWRYYSF